jgi:hypothetical protein
MPPRPLANIDRDRVAWRRAAAVMETRIVSGIVPDAATPRRVRGDFLGLLKQGVRIEAAGQAKHRPTMLISKGYAPRHRIRLFDVAYYLTNLRVDQNFRFFVAYVHLRPDAEVLYPRIFYKDSSLVWRSPSHYVRSDEENWIGKGDVKPCVIDGVEDHFSAEETTNLPLEIQYALDLASRSHGKVPRDDHAVALVLRKAPNYRVECYADFSTPRRKAMADVRNRIHRGECVAYFTRENVPESLKFVRGFEPDFRHGVIEVTPSWSRMYGGEIRKFRILSSNRQIQYQFIAGPRHAWIIPPQALTTEIMSYGVRTIDVEVAEDLCVPGYEYHFLDESEDPPQFYSQIPKGFAGEQSTVDPSRAETSPWLERLPVIREFRRVLRVTRGPVVVSHRASRSA